MSSIEREILFDAVRREFEETIRQNYKRRCNKANEESRGQNRDKVDESNLCAANHSDRAIAEICKEVELRIADLNNQTQTPLYCRQTQQCDKTCDRFKEDEPPEICTVYKDLEAPLFLLPKCIFHKVPLNKGNGKGSFAEAIEQWDTTFPKGKASRNSLTQSKERTSKAGRISDWERGQRLLEKTYFDDTCLKRVSETIILSKCECATRILPYLLTCYIVNENKRNLISREKISPVERALFMEYDYPIPNFSRARKKYISCFLGLGDSIKNKVDAIISIWLFSFISNVIADVGDTGLLGEVRINLGLNCDLIWDELETHVEMKSEFARTVLLSGYKMAPDVVEAEWLGLTERFIKDD